MKPNNINKIKKNLFFGVIGQIIAIILSFIIPRLFILSFGSEVNGFLSLVSQVFIYLNLLESGIGNASTILLYKFISENNRYKIQEVLNSTQLYFRKVAWIYLVIVCVVSIFLPTLVTLSISNLKVFLIVFIQGIAGFLSFYYSSTIDVFLTSDGKNYVISNINTVIRIVTTLVRLVFILLGFDIIIIQFAFLLTTILRVIITRVYFHYNYSDFKISKINANIELLKQRYSFMVHEISSVVFSNTDIILLSIFTNMLLTSIYATYNLFYNGVFLVLQTISNSFNFIIGNLYHKDFNRFLKYFDFINYSFIIVNFIIFSIFNILVLPFLQLYTEGIKDANYIDNRLPVLFGMICVLSAARSTSAKVITIAGYAKETQISSIIEASLNIFLSILFVNLYGITGVLYGTIIALIYRCLDIVIFTNTKILIRLPYKDISLILVNILIFLLINFIYFNNVFFDFDYMDFIFYSLKNAFLITFIYLFINIVCNFKYLKNLYISLLKMNARKSKT